MKKKDDRKWSRRGSAIDWEPFVDGHPDRWEWLFERAIAISNDYADEIDAIERVRAFAFGDTRRRPRAEDVLFVLGIVISLFERDIDFELPGELFADRFPHWVGPTHRFAA